MKSNPDCGKRVIRAMEEFLWIMANGGGDVGNVKAELIACGDFAKPYMLVIGGEDPGDTLSAASSYYQYVRLMRGELKVNADYFRGINADLGDPNTEYSVIVDNLARALRAGDYVSASFLADLAFLARSYSLCVSNDFGGCDWLRRSFKARVLILRSFSKPQRA